MSAPPAPPLLPGDRVVVSTAEGPALGTVTRTIPALEVRRRPLDDVVPGRHAPGWRQHRRRQPLRPDRSHRERRSHTPPEAMMGVLEELEHRYGSVAGYLRANGASEPSLKQMIERLSG